jgi:hypothetical protein
MVNVVAGAMLLDESYTRRPIIAKIERMCA